MHVRWKLELRLISLVCLCVTSISAFAAVAGAKDLVVNVISVGHGDAILIEFPGGETMLVDGGGPSAGDQVFDFIAEFGYTRIDYMVMTHAHDDHVGGLISVVGNLKVGELWTSEYADLTPVYLDFASRTEKEGIPVTIVARGDSFQIGGVTVAVLNPPRGSSLNQLGGSNGASIVLRLTYGATSVLLAGDIDSSRDQELVVLYGDRLQSTVLKCGHHGSDVSSSEEFLNAVDPAAAIVSTGPSQYGYPSPATMARIERLVPHVYRTDRDGTIVVTMDRTEFTVEIR